MVFLTAEQKMLVIARIDVGLGNCNLVARWLEVPDLERGVVLVIRFIVAGLIVALKPE